MTNDEAFDAPRQYGDPRVFPPLSKPSTIIAPSARYQAVYNEAFRNAIHGDPLVWDWRTHRDPRSWDNEQELALLDAVRVAITDPTHTAQSIGAAVQRLVRKVAHEYADAMATKAGGQADEAQS